MLNSLEPFHLVRMSHQDHHFPLTFVYCLKKYMLLFFWSDMDIYGTLVTYMYLNVLQYNLTSPNPTPLTISITAYHCLALVLATTPETVVATSDNDNMFHACQTS